MGEIMIILGRQTGGDRSALGFALDHDMPCPGYCPPGRKAEDGRIPSFYTLQELSAEAYGERTRQNVEFSQGTILFNMACRFSEG
jgi:hypothetical protein